MVEVSNYYNSDEAMSRNPMWLFVISERGIGKTYSTVTKSVRKSTRKLSQLGKRDFDKLKDIEALDVIVWVRRQRQEIDAMKGRFMMNIKHLFPDLEFKEIGYQVFVRVKSPDVMLDSEDSLDEEGKPKKIRQDKWRLLVELTCIKWFKVVKGTPLSGMVGTIVFDEFLPEDGVFYKGESEPNYFANICDSYIRVRDDVKIYMLANALNLHNPYFRQYDIQPDLTGEFTFFKNKRMLIQICPKGKYRKVKSDDGLTPFQSTLAGTDYIAESASVDFKDNDMSLVEERSPRAVPIGVLDMNGSIVSVWYDYNREMLWYSLRRVSSLVDKFSLSMGNGEFSSYHNLRESQLYSLMVNARFRNKIYFDTIGAKAVVVQNLKGSVFL